MRIRFHCISPACVLTVSYLCSALPRTCYCLTCPLSRLTALTKIPYTQNAKPQSPKPQPSNSMPSVSPYSQGRPGSHLLRRLREKGEDGGDKRAEIKGGRQGRTNNACGGAQCEERHGRIYLYASSQYLTDHCNRTTCPSQIRG